MATKKEQEKYIRNTEKKIMKLKKEGKLNQANRLWNKLLNYSMTCDIYTD